MADPSTLRRHYPAFADVAAFPDATVSAFIADAEAELDVEVWAELFERGTIALAAHMLEVGRRAALAGAGAASAGGVSQVKTGDEQVTFAAVGVSTARGDEASLKTTPYGLEFLRIEAQVVRPYFVVI